MSLSHLQYLIDKIANVLNNPQTQIIYKYIIIYKR